MIDVIQRLIKPGTAVKLAAQIEGLVRDGRIAPDSLLPPVRDLARALRVSPGTAASAYKTLRLQGVVTTDGRRGTRVLPRSAQRESGETPAPGGTIDLQLANPDPRLLPDLKRIFAGIDATSDSYGGTHVDADLVGQMARGFESDGVHASDLIVVSGAIAAIHRALRVCLGPGDKVAVEDPGFNEHHASVRAHSMVPVPVPIDDEGVLPGPLAAALRGGARAVILSPRAQSPTGAALSRRRAADLRDVLGRHPDALVLLDDYLSLLSEGAYHDCLGRSERWMVVRSFNKAISPDLRVGVAAADAETAGRLRREQWLADGWVSAYLQRAAAAALASRSVQALLLRASRTYASRRAQLVAALAAGGVEAQGASGLNVWIPVPDEAAAVRGLLDRGWCVRSGARYRIRSAPAIRVTIAQLAGEQIDRLAAAVCGVLGEHRSGRQP